MARYKEEYALLISETQAIKSEMERVSRRVDRSLKLLDSLGSERTRWQDSSRTFEESMSTVSGDVLLSAAFLAYGGYFDQQFRQDMLDTWTNHLAQANLKFKSDLSLVEYLSTADSRLEWQSHALPTDDLSTENAIILSRFNRYPLLIDPSGQATSFLLRHYQDRKMIVSSFLDESFFKQLESALRFGTPLLIQDVEHLDPILNPVLNRELRRAGGRVLIRLGNQDIDFSPSFTLFLATRDPSVDFSPDICSRVSFVNFTMTPASLQTQTLSAVLKSERPDVDKKRSDLLKLQGEFNLRLRHLERSLLQALNSSGPNILDDDKVIDTLETLKTEANEVARKMEDTDAVMQEIDQITTLYQPLAKACSSIYFALDQMSALSHFYQFSLRHFLDIFHSVLVEAKSWASQDAAARLSRLGSELYTSIFARTSRALLHRDHLVLAMVLAQIKMQERLSENTELDLLFVASAGKAGLSALPSSDALHDWLATPDGASFLAADEPEKVDIPLWKEMSGARRLRHVYWWTDLAAVEDRRIRSILLFKAVRPDRLTQAMSAFVEAIFGPAFMAAASYNLKGVVEKETLATTPAILCSVPGLDAAYRVDDLVAEMRQGGEQTQCVSVALGSAEGFGDAEKAIATAARQGSWVMLKNCHVSSSALLGTP
jgi:dynein heavy chain 1